MMRIKKWKILDSNIILENKWLRVRQDRCRLFDGSVIDDYFVVEKPDVVVVIALTSENKVLLVRQYKHGIGKVLIELPGGYVDEEEKLEHAASRELLEETGYTASTLVKIGELVDNPTGMNNVIHVYLARDIERKNTQKLDPNEHIEVVLIDFNEFVYSVWKGNISAQTSVAASFIAINYLFGNNIANIIPEYLRQK